MMQVLLKKISICDYLEQELQAETKSEFHDGEVVAMTGASKNHNLILINLIGELYAFLKGTNCKIYPSDMLLKLEQCQKYVYPDLMIVCEESQTEQQTEKGLPALLNSEVIIEILSESTAHYDRTEKRRCYFMLDSLQQYVMIDSEKMEVTSYTRTQENDWLVNTFKSITEKVKIKDCQIQLSQLYGKISFDKS